jgi:hypothetical protein
VNELLLVDPDWTLSPMPPSRHPLPKVQLEVEICR